MIDKKKHISIKYSNNRRRSHLPISFSLEYIIHTIGKTWQDAQEECKKANAYLIKIDDAAEQSFLEDYLKAKGQHSSSYWIGLNDIQSDGRCMTYLNDQNLR